MRSKLGLVSTLLWFTFLWFGLKFWLFEYFSLPREGWISNAILYSSLAVYFALLMAIEKWFHKSPTKDFGNLLNVKLNSKRVIILIIIIFLWLCGYLSLLWRFPAIFEGPGNSVLPLTLLSVPLLIVITVIEIAWRPEK